MYAQKDMKSGFTLIELLVVITIIGMLASVVLASLSDSRAASQDAAIKQQMSSLISQAELYRTTNGNYGTSNDNDDNIVECTNPTIMPNTMFIASEISSLMQAAYDDYQGNKRAYCAVRIGGNGSWAFSVPMNDQDGVTGSNDRGWCVDSAGTRKEVLFDMDVIGSPLVSGSTARCP